MERTDPSEKTPKERVLSVVICILFTLALPLSSILAGVIFANAGSSASPFWLLAGPLLIALLYILFRKKLPPALIVVNMILTGVFVTALTVFMVIAKGNTDGTLMVGFESALILMFPGYFVLFFVYQYGRVLILAAVLLTLLTALILSVVMQKKYRFFRKAAVYFAALAVLIGVSACFYFNRPGIRYAGHGFRYMNGYSSTDFTDYTVYSAHSKLAVPDQKPALVIEGAENMPILDGAEACYPIYAAAAKAVYKDIDQIEKEALNDPGSLRTNGRIVSFTNTVQGFWRMIMKEPDGQFAADLFFGARPSKSQMDMAEAEHVKLTVTPIGKEAFVFFVEADNPVRNLTSEEIRAIYHGDITNWAEVGGKNQPIVAFQRPSNSGSQTMMEYFMGDVSLKEPETYEYVDSMAGVTKQVAQYANEAGAFGYSFRYFVEDLNQEKNVRVIAVDGVQPTLETIGSGAYPLTTDLCLVSRTDDPNPNVQKMIDFMLSDCGQEIIEKTGYAGR